MDTFTVRDLRKHTGELIRTTEAGKLAIVTKRGRPIFVAVPFNEVLVREGVAVAVVAKSGSSGLFVDLSKPEV